MPVIPHRPSLFDQSGSSVCQPVNVPDAVLTDALAGKQASGIFQSIYSTPFSLPLIVMTQPICAPETAECSKKWSQYRDPLVRSGCEFLTTNGNPQRLCDEFDWVNAMAAQRKSVIPLGSRLPQLTYMLLWVNNRGKNMYLNPYLEEQLDITVQRIERLTAAITSLHHQQKKTRKHRCCPCNAPDVTDIPAECYIALHYAGQEFYRSVDEVCQ